MLTPLPFALHATRGCAPHAELALSLAGAFHDVDATVVDARLERLAARMPAPASDEPLDQLRALARLLRDPALPAPGHEVDADELLLDSALARGCAHPVLRAVVAVEVARRHGIEAGLVSNGVDHCVAHERLGEPLLARAADGVLVDAHTLGGRLQWRCSHEACGLLLDGLEERWLRCGRLGEALHAAQLRLCLPFAETSLREARLRLAQVRARLN